jgi:hypothetical protein
MTDIELIARNIRNSVEAAKIPEVCLTGCEGEDIEVDTTNAAIHHVDNTVRVLIAALEDHALDLSYATLSPEPVTETRIDEILKITERMAKINEALKVLGESKIYLNSLKAVLSRKY